MRLLACLLILSVGCQGVVRHRGVRPPFSGVDARGTERSFRFLGPTLLHGIEFSVQIEEVADTRHLTVLPPGLIVLDAEVLVRKHPYRHFHFEIDGKPYFFKKGSKVFILDRADSEEVLLSYLGLLVALKVTPGKRVVVVWWGQGRVEELRYGSAVIGFSQGSFMHKDGRPLSPAVLNRGVRMTSVGKVELR